MYFVKEDGNLLKKGRDGNSIVPCKVMTKKVACPLGLVRTYKVYIIDEKAVFANYVHLGRRTKGQNEDAEPVNRWPRTTVLSQLTEKELIERGFQFK